MVLRGKDLDPEAVTACLGISPTWRRRRGEARRITETWRHGFWELESSAHVQSEDLAEHLRWVADQIEPVAHTLSRFLAGSGTEMEIRCAWMFPGANGFTLSALLLERIAALGLPLVVSAYCEEYLGDTTTTAAARADATDDDGLT